MKKKKNEVQAGNMWGGKKRKKKRKENEKSKSWRFCEDEN